MMDWIAGAYGGIKAATDITQGMLTLKTDAAVTTKVVELNGVLLGLQGQLNAAHAEHTDLTARIRELEAEIAKYIRWEKESARYTLTTTEFGTFIYRIKPECQGGEPDHSLCVKCFDEGVKSVLQPYNSLYVNCPRCETSLQIKPSVPRKPRPRSRLT
ncbi:hypothetical protein [Pseudomonas aeruginosa]|uniref:hypothetical protein n=1 Tax=Pseudomonas aeruginosa TaxID=287 RepID=UPI001F3EB1C6|nr:hypothetical protein [Pseudomonas aeruginosa]MCS8370362.1 hypothetical protein [Pseudomonas aeruginosa]